jgi:PAS domain S-box-containing protein
MSSVRLTVNLGFLLAMIVLFLSGYGSYEGVKEVVAVGEQARQEQRERLLEFRIKLADPALKAPDEVQHLVEERVKGEIAAAGRTNTVSEEPAKRTANIVLAATILSILIALVAQVLINHDTQARQVAEANLLQAHADLEERVRQRTAELEKIRAQLEERVRERTADLAQANEDLRQENRVRGLVENALQETLTLQNAILDSANYSIVSTDATGLIRTYNAAAERWFGYSPAEVVLKSTPLLLHDDKEIARRQRELGGAGESAWEVLVARARAQNLDEQEWTFINKDGSRFPGLLSVTALRDEADRISGFLLVGSDIRVRWTHEQEMRRAREAAETANKTKSEFLANMSHELRTPLTSVIGFTNILLKNKAGNLRDQDLTFLGRVLDNGKHLLALINEVLDLAKVEAGRMDLDVTSIALGDLIRETLAGLEGQLRDKDLRLVAEVPSDIPHVATDRGKLKQVLINLIGNALKFTERGTVTVRVDSDPLTHRPLAIEVIDTGIGIPSEKLGKVFEAFQQADASTSRRYGGTGLGLTIAQSICRLLGYTIEVQSRVGIGSTFRIVFGERAEVAPSLAPTASGRFRAMRALQSGLPALAGKKVLVIDDDSDSRLLLTQHVEDCGCRVLAVDTGEQALALAREYHPDLIVLDLMMPGMSGWDVLKVLKANPLLCEVPVVVVSLVAGENRGTIFGAVDLLDKPVSREGVHAMLRRNLAPECGRVLVVDDNPDSRRLATTFLAEEGFETREAVNGSDALKQLQDFTPDLIILDLMMPEMDGMTFLEALRREPRYLRLPVVVVTAKDLSERETQRLGTEAAAVLRKGEELAAGLKRVVREVLRNGSDE